MKVDMWDVLRWLNVFMAAGAASLLMASTIRRWEGLSPRVQRITVWFIVILLVIAYGSGEAAAQNAPEGLRVIMMLLALAGLIGTLLYRFNERDSGPRRR